MYLKYQKKVRTQYINLIRIKREGGHTVISIVLESFQSVNTVKIKQERFPQQNAKSTFCNAKTWHNLIFNRKAYIYIYIYIYTTIHSYLGIPSCLVYRQFGSFYEVRVNSREVKSTWNCSIYFCQHKFIGIYLFSH